MYILLFLLLILLLTCVLAIFVLNKKHENDINYKTKENITIKENDYKVNDIIVIRNVSNKTKENIVIKNNDYKINDTHIRNVTLEQDYGDRDTCNQYILKYNIKNGISWGTAPLHIQTKWKQLQCDLISKNGQLSDIKECHQYKNQYDIKNGYAWGLAPFDIQPEWKRRNCDSIIPLYEKIDPIFFLQANYNTNSNIIWRIVTGYQTPERTRNVERILKSLNISIEVLNEYKGIGNNCTNLLYKENIRINPKYFDGSGLIQSGKLGHWCSFLRFLKVLNSSNAEIGIWIEDDADLQPEHVNSIKAHIYSKDIKPAYPITRVSIADTVLVIQKSGFKSMWDPLVRNGILYPTDIFYKNLGLVLEKNLQISRIKTNNSTISSTISLNITNLNRIIGKKKEKSKTSSRAKWYPKKKGAKKKAPKKRAREM